MKRFLVWLRCALRGSAVVADEECNVLLGSDAKLPDAGNPHATISARLGQMRANGSIFACHVCNVLTAIARTIFRSQTTDHCGDAMKAAL